MFSLTIKYKHINAINIKSNYNLKTLQACLNKKDLDRICLSESGFRKITFQIFLCLFTIRKVRQRKTLFDQQKTLFSQRKIWLGFQESVFLLFWVENTFWKL